MRIAFLVSSLHLGGAENVIYELVTRLPPDRFETAVWCLKEPGEVGERLQRAGAQVASGLQGSRPGPLTPVRLTSHMRSFRPHIVFTLDHHNAIFWSGLVAGIGKHRRVLASHTTGRMDDARSFTTLDRLWIRSVDVVVALSESHARYLCDVEGVPKEKLETIENGIDVERFAAADRARVASLRRDLDIAADTAVIAMVAVLRPEKAHEALLQAAKMLTTDARADRSLKFLIVGDGPLRGHLEARARDLGVESDVSFLGIREDIPDILALSHVAVLPSHDAVETLPLAVMEAMAAGVPVVASRVGSVPELIEDGVSGRLIEPANADGLAAAITDIISDGASASLLAQTAREAVSARYGVQRMVDAYSALFERLTHRT